jgi:hypothetical protein
MADVIHLRQSMQRHLDAGSVAVIGAGMHADGNPVAFLAVNADGEYEFTLRVGETFPIGEQIWRLDDVDDPYDDWTVVLSRVR